MKQSSELQVYLHLEQPAGVFGVFRCAGAQAPLPFSHLIVSPANLLTCTPVHRQTHFTFSPFRDQTPRPLFERAHR